MYRTFLGCLFVVSLFVVSFSLLSGKSSSSEPQVQAAQISVPTFEHTAGMPDPNEIFQMVNKARLTAGQPALRADARLSAIAKQRATDMAQQRYYAHQSPEGFYYYDLMKQQRINTDYSCENLDMEFSLDALPYVTDWLGSSAGHRECLLNKEVTSAGYAVAKLSAPQKPSDTNTYIVVAIHAAVVR